jgi:hypothetical protein
VTLQSEIESERGRRSGRVFLDGLKAEHQDCVFAGRGGQPPHFKTPAIIGSGSDFVSAAFRRDSGARDWDASRAHEARLDIGGGNTGE